MFSTIPYVHLWHSPQAVAIEVRSPEKNGRATASSQPRREQDSKGKIPTTRTPHFDLVRQQYQFWRWIGSQINPSLKVRSTKWACSIVGGLVKSCCTRHSKSITHNNAFSAAEDCALRSVVLTPLIRSTKIILSPLMILRWTKDLVNRVFGGALCNIRHKRFFAFGRG